MTVEVDTGGSLEPGTIVRLNRSMNPLPMSKVRCVWNMSHMNDELYEVVTSRKVTRMMDDQTVISIEHTARVKDCDGKTYMVDVAGLTPIDIPVPFIMGQRVLMYSPGIGSEICTIVKSETGDTQGAWVYVPSRGYASDYALHNIQPLPDGKL